VSPYILGFATVQAASWIHFIAGVLVAVLALWSAITVYDAGGVASKIERARENADPCAGAC
jgi:hypothetical protein